MWIWRVFPVLFCFVHPSSGLWGNGLVDMDLDIWKAKHAPRGVSLESFVMPLGVQARDPEVRSYWKQQPSIPSAIVTIAFEMTRANAEDDGHRLESELLDTCSSASPDSNDFQIRIMMNHATNNALTADATLPFSPEFTINIGAGSEGDMLLRCALMRNGDMVAYTSQSFTISPLLLAHDHPHLMGAIELKDRPPTFIPPDLLPSYLSHPSVKLFHWYFDDKSDRSKSYQTHSYDSIQRYIAGATQRTRFYYNLTDAWLYEALDRFPIKGKHVLIIGSNMPVYESICIAFEAALCVTLEYNRLEYHHPDTHTRTVDQWNEERDRLVPCEWAQEHYANCEFDAVWSISSFEHDGLGRYGDPINPDADLEAMESMKVYGHSGTHYYVAVPVGLDAVFWNEGRVYGPHRLPKLLSSYFLVDSFGISAQDVRTGVWGSDFSEERGHHHERQPVFVLTKRP